MLKSLFGLGRKTPDLPPELGPLRCAIKGAFEIDTLGLQASLAAGDPAMGPPLGGPFIVSAIGTARLDGANELTRYYDDDHRMIQVIAQPGGGPDTVTDVSLYAPWDSVVPGGVSEWNRWTGPSGLIGAPSYDADGIAFTRYWGSGDDHSDLIEFVETTDDGEHKRQIHQRCMLYARPVGAGQEMLLLNIESDVDQLARREGASIEFLIGYGLSIADVQRV